MASIKLKEVPIKLETVTETSVIFQCESLGERCYLLRLDDSTQRIRADTHFCRQICKEGVNAWQKCELEVCKDGASLRGEVLPGGAFLLQCPGQLKSEEQRRAWFSNLKVLGITKDNAISIIRAFVHNGNTHVSNELGVSACISWPSICWQLGEKCMSKSAWAALVENVKRTCKEEAFERLWDLLKAERPRWLPSSLPIGHPGQMKVDAKMWCMTFRQFKNFVQYVQGTLLYHVLKASRGLGQPLTLYDLNEHFVKKWTAGTGASISLLLNPEGLQPKLMVSHAWGEDNEELAEALNRYFQAKGISDGTPLWICLFALYQAEDQYGPSVQSQLDLTPSPFAAVIGAESLHQDKGGSGMVAVHTTTANLFDRLWCPYEMNEAKKKTVKVGMAHSYRYYEQLLKRYHYALDISDGDQITAFSMMDDLAVTTAAAVCTNDADTERIRSAIQKDGGFDILDRIIKELRITMIKECLREANPNSAEAPLTEEARMRQLMERMLTITERASAIQAAFQEDVLTELRGASARQAAFQEDMLTEFRAVRALLERQEARRAP